MDLTAQNPLNIYRSFWDFLSESSNDYYFYLDFSTLRIYFSSNIRAHYDVLPADREYCTVADWKRLVHPRDLPKLQEVYQLVLSGQLVLHNVDYRVLSKAGELLWINSRGKIHYSDRGEPQWMVGRLSDSALRNKADHFTGAFNMESLKEELQQIQRDETDGFLLVVGVDDLKAINLKKGRAFGDGILKHAAEALEDATLGERRIYRLNGDCFAVTCPQASADDVRAIFHQTQRRLEGLCTLSGGCVPFREYPALDACTLYQYAETSLDHAKAQGKNMLRFFCAEDYEREIVAMELKEDLQISIKSGFSGFSLCYQPQIHSNSYRLYGAEALLRYTSPRRGPISPAEFIPILEQTKLVCPVGLWVLDTALDQCRLWRRLQPDFHISVNMSFAQLQEEDIVTQVLASLRRSGLPGSALTIEVTESMQLLDYQSANTIFRQWKNHGIEIAVDDFGTGYSSLGRLKEMEIDEIKIDRCFVRQIQHSAYNYRLLSNMLELADSCQIRVCCEGIETEEELTTLEELQPALLQGFLFSRPCPPSELEERYFQPESPLYQSRVQAEEDYRRRVHPLPIPPSVSWSENEIARLLLEAENDIFYISDMDTYELYYLNPAGQKLFGVRDYHGRKCYKVLQGLDEPCPFCTNPMLRQDDFYIWEQENDYCGRHFLLKDKVVYYQNKRLRMEVALDITKREFISQSAQAKLDFAAQIVGYVDTLSEHTDFREAVDQVLASVGEFYKADRAYLFEPTPDRSGYWDNTFEWCSERVTSQMDHLQQLPPRLLARWMSLFQQDQSVVLLNLEPLRQSDPDEWRVLSRQGIRRLIAVPIWDKGQLLGFLGVDNPRHAIQDDAQVRVLSAFLLHRIRQERNEKRYQQLLRTNFCDVFDTLNLGLWVIRLSQDRTQQEMLANDTMHRVLGLSDTPTPQACYQFWYSRINEGYYHYVNQSLEQMIESGRTVQLEYTWRHPTRGEVLVRCTGIRMPDEHGMICLKGYHRIISDIEQPQYLPSSCVRDIFEYNELNRSIFFHTGRVLLLGEDTHETNFPQCWIDSGIVHPHFVSEFRAAFSRLRSKEHSTHLELLLKSKSGTYEWFKLTVQHLSHEQKDLDTVIILLEPAGMERVMELEYMRMRRFYQALLSEAIAYAEVDLESGQLKSVGGLWHIYQQDYRLHSQHFIDLLQQKLAKFLPPEELDFLKRYRDPACWDEMFERQETSSRFCYRRLVGESLRWVEFTIYLFQEEITRNVYALIYLKDINAEKEREFAQAEAASRDPLTNIYNRAAFQREMSRCISSAPGPCGTLMLLDIDNFKAINDRSGHLEGDRALKTVADLLLSAFRKQDIVGRMGGDEFLVFIQGDFPRPRLEERLRMLLETLQSVPGMTLSGSIGLTRVYGGNSFDYSHVLGQADTALYHSKRSGKNRFCFFEDLPGE